MLQVKYFRAIAIIGAIVVSGCATVQPGVAPKTFHSTVDSLARSDAAEKRRYVLLPGGKGVDVGDLQFQEFAAYIDKVLSGAGFTKVASLHDADVAIFLSYAIGDPETYQYSYALPTWGQTGVASANSSGSISFYGNTATYSGRTTYTPTYGVTGSTTQIDTITRHSRFLLLDAYDVVEYAKDSRLAQVWKTNVVSIGSSNDLRLVMPYMVVAMTPHVGKNTGRKVEVAVPEDDAAIKLLRGDASSIIK